MIIRNYAAGKNTDIVFLQILDVTSRGIVASNLNSHSFCSSIFNQFHKLIHFMLLPTEDNPRKYSCLFPLIQANEDANEDAPLPYIVASLSRPTSTNWVINDVLDFLRLSRLLLIKALLAGGVLGIWVFGH